jgi:hypothetical protein
MHVTEHPLASAAVATSAPIHPAPTMTTLTPGCSRLRSARASSMLRIVCCSPSPGSRTGVAPVAMTRPS